MAKTNDLFYSRLPVNEIPLAELLMEEHLFYNIPGDWHVVITDVEKSTAAFAEGQHEKVNLVATGSMVAVLNIADKAGCLVPSFFGGDGATFIIPASMLDMTLHSLTIHHENTFKNFNLRLRVGQVSVADINANGHQLTICKLRTSKLFVIPVVLGEGLSYAEKIIKHPNYILPPFTKKNTELDLGGMQCRWDRIEPPQNDQEVMSLLVMAQKGARQTEVFKKVIDQLDAIYGGQEKRKPISAPRLRLKNTIQKLVLEMRTKFGKYKPFYLAKVWMTSLAAPYYFKTRDGKKYLDQLVDMSDNLVIDGKINTVISGTAMQREQLIAALNTLENEGSVVYGFYVSKQAVLSCYVRSLDEHHVHFVDGADGGYTKAAGMLKKKLNREDSENQPQPQ